jgi:predicted heme/steroid binding protein
MKKVSPLSIITFSLNTVLVLLAIIASLQFRASAWQIQLASLLAVVAFSLMWVHYASDVMKRFFYPDQTIVTQTRLTQRVVLVAILAHPLLINFYLISSGFGFPPQSYSQYVGDSKAIFVLFGIIALLCFLLYEAKHWFRKRHLDMLVGNASIAGMFLVLIHGFKIGFIINNSWYIYVWWLFLITFSGFAIYFYLSHYKNDNLKKSIGLACAVIASIVAMYAGYNASASTQLTNIKQKSASSSQEAASQKTSSEGKLSLAELSTKNGINGSECWVAVDGVVYDVTGNPQWQNGQHLPSEGKAKCGEDLSDAINQSPHGRSVLNNLVRIGRL